MKKLCALCLALALCLSVPALAAGPAFTDVPEHHWAYDYVEEAAANGWVNGVGNGQFAPEREISYAEFSTMLVRAYYEDELNAYTGSSDPWFMPYCTVAHDLGLYDGTNMGQSAFDAIAEISCNRYEMAQLLYNILNDQDAMPEHDAASVQAKIGDWGTLTGKYKDAVTGVFAAGIIGGVDANGTFNGNGVMTRAQAAAVMCRMDEVVSGSEVTEPVDPEPTPEPADGMLKNGKLATPENVIEMLKEIEEEYPTGTVWTDPVENPDTPHNPNPVSETVHRVMLNKGTDDVYACGGFAAMVSDLIFPEDMELREVTDLSQVRPGDIVFNMDRNGNATHVWVALSDSYLNQTGYWSVSGCADGNYPDQVRWDWETGRVMWEKDEVPGFGYHVVYTRYPN